MKAISVVKILIISQLVESFFAFDIIVNFYELQIYQHPDSAGAIMFYYHVYVIELAFYSLLMGRLWGEWR